MNSEIVALAKTYNGGPSERLQEELKELILKELAIGSSDEESIVRHIESTYGKKVNARDGFPQDDCDRVYEVEVVGGNVAGEFAMIQVLAFYKVEDGQLKDVDVIAAKTSL